jgi:hypothetical protein
MPQLRPMVLQAAVRACTSPLSTGSCCRMASISAAPALLCDRDDSGTPKSSLATRPSSWASSTLNTCSASPSLLQQLTMWAGARVSFQILNSDQGSTSAGVRVQCRTLVTSSDVWRHAHTPLRRIARYAQVCAPLNMRVVALVYVRRQRSGTASGGDRGGDEPWEHCNPLTWLQRDAAWMSVHCVCTCRCLSCTVATAARSERLGGARALRSHMRRRYKLLPHGTCHKPLSAPVQRLPGP